MVYQNQHMPNKRRLQGWYSLTSIVRSSRKSLEKARQFTLRRRQNNSLWASIPAALRLAKPIDQNLTKLKAKLRQMGGGRIWWKSLYWVRHTSMSEIVVVTDNVTKLVVMAALCRQHQYWEVRYHGSMERRPSTSEKKSLVPWCVLPLLSFWTTCNRRSRKRKRTPKTIIWLACVKSDLELFAFTGIIGHLPLQYQPIRVISTN